MRAAFHLGESAGDLRRDAMRAPQLIFPASIAPHGCNRITAMQCERLGHAMSARHLCSKQVGRLARCANDIRKSAIGSAWPIYLVESGRCGQ